MDEYQHFHVKVGCLHVWLIQGCCQLIAPQLCMGAGIVDSRVAARFLAPWSWVFLLLVFNI